MRTVLAGRLLLALALLVASWGALAAGSSFGFGQLEARLHLDRAQKAQFDAAVGATREAMLATGLVALRMKAQIAGELARDRPDPKRLLADSDAIAEELRPNWRIAHDEWTRLYAMLDERQVALARDYVERRLRMLEGVGGEALGRLWDALPPASR